MQWETVIGLEIHTQLTTKSKIFSGASTAFGAEPNTQACLVDLGFPGVLPVLNEAVVKKAILFGTAVGAEIARRAVFARKNYFYPDLPKGYQISQLELPIVGPGHVDIPLESGESKRIGITRAHLEEDAGKSLHEDFHGMTGIDLNRAGTPLLEIVSEPDMSSAKEALAYAKKIHQIVVYLGICDGNMQEGSLRVDANVSVRPVGQKELGTRAELKNINSFRFLEKAINFEVERQINKHSRIRGQGSTGNPPVRCRQGRNPFHALQGRGQRLPLFSRPGSAAANHRRRFHCRNRHGNARAAHRQTRPVRGAIRPVCL